MEKLLAIIFAGLLVLISACGGEETTSSTNDPTTDSQVTPSNDLTPNITNNDNKPIKSDPTLPECDDISVKLIGTCTPEDAKTNRVVGVFGNISPGAKIQVCYKDSICKNATGKEGSGWFSISLWLSSWDSGHEQSGFPIVIEISGPTCKSTLQKIAPVIPHC